MLRLSLGLSHFLRRTGNHFAGKCSGHMPGRPGKAPGKPNLVVSIASWRAMGEGERQPMAALRPMGVAVRHRRAGDDYDQTPKLMWVSAFKQAN